MSKLIGDFTGSPLMMLPHFLGGAYWLCSLCSTQIIMMVSVHFYNRQYDHPDGPAAKIAPATLWKLAAALTTTWVLT